MVNVVTLNYENSLDRFISEEKNVVYKTVSSKKLAGWVDGWMDGRESRVKDCLQQSKNPAYSYKIPQQ
jgi:hypothetical protein